METAIKNTRQRAQQVPSRLISVERAYKRQERCNRAYIEHGEVKLDFVTDTLSIKEAEELTLRAVELEYSLP